jgi:hypothetical protein
MPYAPTPPIYGPAPRRSPQPFATPTPYATPTPNGAPSPSPTPLWAIETIVEYDSQFADVLSETDARRDFLYYGTIVPYADLIVGYETNPSRIAGLSQLYNQNAVIPSVGVRYPFGVFEYGELFAQAGYSFGLRGERSFPETRYGFDYARDYGISFESAYPHGEVAGQIADYSRFEGNIIGQVQAFYDARLTPGLRPIVGADLGFDTHRDYGNNYLEAYAGFMIPFSTVFDFRFVGVEGTYLSRGVDRPSPPSYSGIRITLQHEFPQ